MGMYGKNIIYIKVILNLFIVLINVNLFHFVCGVLCMDSINASHLPPHTAGFQYNVTIFFAIIFTHFSCSFCGRCYCLRFFFYYFDAPQRRMHSVESSRLSPRICYAAHHSTSRLLVMLINMHGDNKMWITFIICLLSNLSHIEM